MSDNVVEAIELLKDVRNEFVQSVILQWKRGANLSNKQVIHLLLLAEQQKRSIERGFTGIDHGVTDEQWKEIKAKLGLKNTPKSNQKEETGFKKRYTSKELQPLLDEIDGKLEKVVSESEGYRGFKESVWKLTLGCEVKEFRTLLDFVKYITDNDPEHPLLKLKGDKN